MKQNPGTAAPGADAPVVTTESGDVAGARRDGLDVFLGIPYAAPPVGPLRWRAPRPPESWDGIRDATAFGPAAPQPVWRKALFPRVRMSEDCLSINVFAPHRADESLPVMVWIHGGAYYVGSSAEAMFDGEVLAREGRVVVVTFNYRLGALGYLDLSSFSVPGDRFDSNPGQRDQLAALEWVRRNIRAFGGDPGRVTVFGESAGAGAVTTHLATPAARGLFRAAVAQSAPVGSVYSAALAAGFARRFFKLVGVSPREAGRLRDLDVELLTDASNRLIAHNSRVAPGTIPFAPSVDGELVPEYPLTAFADGRALAVPLLIGTNRNESALFRLLRSPIVPTNPSSLQLMFENIGATGAARIARAYTGYPRKAAALSISTDAAFRMPTIWAATGHSAYAPTWVYRFDYAHPLAKAVGLGAVHGSELPYVWGNDFVRTAGSRLLGSAAAVRVGRLIRARWTHFAQELDPNSPDAEVRWPHYDAGERATLVIDREDAVERDPWGRRRRAWGDEVVAFR